jgi:hypothetical protein
MTFIILAVGGFLAWKYRDKISGVFKNNLGSTQPSPRPTPQEEDSMRQYHRASQTALYTLRDKYHEEYERYVQQWLEAHPS